MKATFTGKMLVMAPENQIELNQVLKLKKQPKDRLQPNVKIVGSGALVHIHIKLMTPMNEWKHAPIKGWTHPIIRPNAIFVEKESLKKASALKRANRKIYAIIENDEKRKL